MANKIKIHVVLSLIDQSNADGRKNYFSLQYVKNNGELRHFKQALKHRPGENPTPKTEPKKAQNHHMKSSGNVRIFDVPANSYKEIAIDQIVMFNGIKVDHA